MTDFLSPQVHVRGQSHFDAQASLKLKLLSTLVDLAIIAIVYFLTSGALGRFPIPTLGEGALVFGLGALVRSLLQFFTGASPGQHAWKLRLRRAPGESPESLGEFLHSQVRVCERTGTPEIIKASLISGVLLLSACTLGWVTLLNHPLTMAASGIQLPVFVPSELTGGKKSPVPQDEKGPGSSWAVMPFYYSNGAWPLQFAGHPVFYVAPYEKGPPTHFLGRIIARWDMPDTKLTIQGPITPARGSPRKIWESCMKQAMSCLKLRKEGLSRAVEEMKALKLKHWNVRWFRVDNPLIPEDERPEGIYISAENETRAQDRMILINEKGTQQAFILDRPSSEGEGPSAERSRAAQHLFEQAMGSQRVTNELDTGRAWINRMLADVKMSPAIAGLSDSEFVTNIAKTQALLLSKISVEPKVLDAYYHLGGTALVLARRANKAKNAEWSSAAKILLQSAYHYAQDISPDDPRTRQLESSWVEVKNY
ncbi:MAG: hypothetical protein H7222_04050 [Methylotenera sp.]|nr:hypothetical protein [Oligoflexia bacterium]